MRFAEFTRTTEETRVAVRLELDGGGAGEIDTSVPFMDHMLRLFAKHGFFDLTVDAHGDLEVDYHHIMEDLGLALGETLRRALGNKHGIARYGSALTPMDEALARIAVDLSGRPCLVYQVAPPAPWVKDIDSRLFHEFFQGLAVSSGMNLHIDLIRADEVHHAFEAIFKGFAKALDQATAIDPRVSGVLSTKGSL